MRLITCTMCDGSGKFRGLPGDRVSSSPCLGCNGTGKIEARKSRKKRRAKVRPVRMSKLRSDVSKNNRGLMYVVEALENERAVNLELQRRLQKLEKRLGVAWVSDHQFDGEHKAI